MQTWFSSWHEQNCGYWIWTLRSGKGVLGLVDVLQVNLVNSNMLSFVPGMSTDPRTDLDIAGFNLDQSFQTKAAYATLEPEYNETAHFVLENLGSQVGFGMLG